jgi:hypothetical protein
LLFWEGGMISVPLWLVVVLCLSCLMFGVAIGALFLQPTKSSDAGDDPDPGKRKAA